MKMENKEIMEEIKEKDAKAKLPVFIKELELGDGEIYVGQLSDADKMQLLIRHINIMEQALNNTMFLASTCAVCLEELCKDKGIDIDKAINKKN